MATTIPSAVHAVYSNGESTQITYTWAVTGLKTKQEGAYTNAVVQTYWSITGTDSAGHIGEFSGATPFSTVDQSSEYAFIDFATLQESDVLAWIQDIVVGTYADHIMEQIFNKLDAQANTVVTAALPWAPAVPEVP